MAIRTLNDFNFYVGVCTNQSGIARGYMTERDNVDILSRMHELLDLQAKAKVDLVTWCPHNYDDGHCNCRKPRTGQWLKHLREGGSAVLEAKKKMFYMVGDMTSDIEFARNIGAQPIFVTCGLASYSDALHKVGALPCALDLTWAVQYILDQHGLEVPF